MIELLVVTAIFGILVGITVPAVMQARKSASRLHCLNNLRNVNLAILMAVDQQDRFPACGKFGPTTTHGSWVLDILPFIDQAAIYNRWNMDGGIADSGNQQLMKTFIPVLTCPNDISVVRDGDLSYAVNGGVGFTAQISGVHDCPVDPQGRKLDMNGNGVICPAPNGEAEDRDLFFQMGLFFNETYKWDVTIRHHTLATVTDGLSQTIVLSENVRVGYDPVDPQRYNWSSSDPYRTSFYFGNPCKNAKCSPGNVDYSQSNSGRFAINSGLMEPEGASQAPNSFHTGGVHMSFGDGSARFINQSLNGSVYAALMSPQGASLNDTLRQAIP